MILAIAMLVIGLFFLFYNEKFCLYFLVFILPFTRSSQVMILCLLVGLLTIKILIKMFLKEKCNYKRTFFDVPAILFIAIWTVTTFTSVSVKKSFTDYIISMLGIIFCLLCIQVLENKKDYITLISSLLLSNVCISLYGIYQYFIEKPINEGWVDKNVNPDMQIRAYSVLGNPNILSQYLLLILPIGIMLMIYKKKLSHKIILGIMNALIFLCLLLTISRASIFGILVSLLVIAVIRYSQLLIILIPVAIILLVVFAPSIIERLLTSFNSKDTSISSRMTIWQDVFYIIKDYFFTGIGYGVTAFSGLYLLYKHQYLTALHAHNLFLEILAETGIVGFLIFVYFAFSFISNMMKNYMKNTDNFNKCILLGALASFIGILVNGMAEYTWSDFRVVSMFWIVIGIGASLTQINDSKIRNEECK